MYNEVVLAAQSEVSSLKHGELVDVLVTPGDWVCVPFAKIAGGTDHQQQLAAQQLTNHAGFPVPKHLNAKNTDITRGVTSWR